MVFTALASFRFVIAFSWPCLLRFDLDANSDGQGCCVSFCSRDSSNTPPATAAATATAGVAEERCTGTASSPPEVQGSTSTIVPNSHSATTLAATTTPFPSTTIETTSPPASHVDPCTARRRAASVVANQFPLSEHFNAPIRPHVWYSKRRVWTRAHLDRERREFFETRVTGRPEIWTALAAALSFMRDSDLETAQSIIDAAGITVPTGDLCQGCYDEQGALYRLPQCIVSDPENMVQTDAATTQNYFDEDDDDDDDYDDEGLSDGKLIGDDDASGDELITEDLEQRRDEKGKTSERDLISVRARLSVRGGLDHVMSVGKNRSVGFIARKIQQEADVCYSKTRHE